MENAIINIPLVKTENSKRYTAILSDDSIDRDGELISPELIKEWASDPNRYLPMLVDHQNKVENLVGKWTNPTILIKEFENRKGYALSLQPKWFVSNPKAKMIKEMIEEDGAQIGLSIGARPIESKSVEIDGKKYKMWTKAELLEGSLTPVPANANCMIVAKSYLDKAKYPWDQCIADQLKRGYTKEQAQKICGAIRARSKEGEIELEKKDLTAFEEERKKRKMSVAEFYAVPRDPPSESKLPIFDAAHVRNAMARFNQTQFKDAEEKKRAYNKILRAARKFGIDVSEFEKLKPKSFMLEPIEKEDLEKPFAGYKDFDACVKDQLSKGKSEESAKKICGALQARAEGKSYSLGNAHEKNKEEKSMAEDEEKQPEQEEKKEDKMAAVLELVKAQQEQIAKLAKVIESKSLDREAELKAVSSTKETEEVPVVDKAVDLTKMLKISRGVFK